MLGQGIDGRQRLKGLGTSPVLGELLRVQPRPLPDQPQRTRRKRPVDDPQSGQLDLSDLITVLRVEMRSG